MAEPRTAHILNRATSQADRRAGAPDPEAFDVDGRSLAQILAFAAHYGGLIRFYDLEDTQQGDWTAFFASDPVAAAALHAALDLAEIERTLQRLIAAARHAAGRHFRRSRIERVLAMLARLIGILDREHPGQGTAETQLRQLHNAAQRRDALAEPLHKLRRHTVRDSLADALDHDHAGRDPGWGETLIDILEDVIETLIDVLRHGMAAAQSALTAALASHDHAPQAALYNAFALLFVEARHALNAFPRRLVDYYYGEVLQQHSLAAKPDELFLTFTPANPAAQASVPRGAVFPAGTDKQGAAINYAALNALEVTPTKVTGISVHRVADTGSGNLISGVLSGEVALDPNAPDAFDPFPMFGADSSFGPLKMQSASMGFTVASPTLMLQGGKRTVTIGLVVAATSLAPPPTVAPNQDQALIGLAGDVASLIETTFSLHYSTAGGWETVEDFTVTPLLGTLEAPSSIFSIVFDLPPDAPPLVATSTKPALGAPAPSLPASAFPSIPEPAVIGSLISGADVMTQQAWNFVDTLATLSRLQIDEVTIGVTVAGLADLKVATPNGPADTTQNFAIFGLPPAKYSWFSLSAPELFAKPITSLSVTIAWAGLPVTSTGFQGYYQDYLIDADGVVSDTPLFDNTSFKGVFSIVDPGAWTVTAGDALPLFRTTPPAPVTTAALEAAAENPPAPAAPLLPLSVISAPVTPIDVLPAYYDPAKSSLKLSLVAPDYAFGNALYPNNLMAATQPPPPSKRHRDDPPPPPRRLPNPPWLPMASAVTIDYSASASFSLAPRLATLSPANQILPAPAAPVSFLHVAPFDRLTPPSPSTGMLSLLPPVEPRSALYIELSDPAEQITLLFILGAGPNGWWSKPPRMRWEQHVSGTWHAVTVLDDGTNGLMNSGIVSLQLKPLPAGKTTTRLRIQALEDANDAPLVKAVIANAVTAEWIGPGGGATRGIPLPQNAITKSQTALANVGTIAQPMQSFGGCPPAEGGAFQMWMAERLRHKGYAIAGWDYARLVLEAVPSLWQCAVVPATDEVTGREAPGRVWIVPVAGPATPNVTDKTAPLVDLTTLSDIGTLLKSVVSPFAADAVAVTNPPYLRLQVTAGVIFTDDDTAAYWEIQLGNDLVAWLSPWPDPKLGPRPANYYTERAVAEFVRHRPYVVGITSLSIAPYDPPAGGPDWYYFTSAPSHLITGYCEGGTTQAADETAPGVRQHGVSA